METIAGSNPARSTQVAKQKGSTAMSKIKVPINSACAKSPNGMHQWKTRPVPGSARIITWCEHCNMMAK